MSLTAWHFGFAIQYGIGLEPITISVVNGSDAQLGTIEFTFVAPVEPYSPRQTDVLRTIQPERGWAIIFAKIKGKQLTIPAAGRYFLELRSQGEQKATIGEFSIVQVDAPLLTQDRIAAIRTDPKATKFVRVDIGCGSCTSKCRAYAGLERSPKLEADGYTWHHEMIETFICECGKTRLDLRSLRKNLHAPIGRSSLRDGADLAYEPLYEAGALVSLRLEFIKLLDEEPSEEDVQKFIERNPVVLHQFPAERLLFKPAILALFKADFAILTPQKELVLIEIEKPGTRLIKKDGGVAAPLQHALDQIHAWLHVVDEHRLAVLESMQIDRNQVSSVRGVVVAGRDEAYDPELLRRFKGTNRGRVSILTYDDLASSMASLGHGMQSL